MKKIASMYGYEIYELSREEARKEGRVYPCLCAFYDDWDDEEDGVRDVNYSECEFDNLDEANEWCKEYRRR